MLPAFSRRGAKETPRLAVMPRCAGAQIKEPRPGLDVKQAFPHFRSAAASGHSGSGRHIVTIGGIALDPTFLPKGAIWPQITGFEWRPHGFAGFA